MSVSDLQFLIDLALAKYTSNLWLASVFALILGGVGAFLGAYLQKRGENRATNENFTAIRSQLQTTTRDTEDIKQQLSGRAWKSQQHWRSRDEYYSKLLTHLHHFQLALGGISEYFMEPGSEHIRDSQRDDRFRGLFESSRVSYAEIERLVGPSAIYLSARALEALNQLFVQHWDLANYGAGCTAEYVNSAQSLAIDAYNQVLIEAKRDLGVENA
jgi:hypothetical protein